MLMRGDAYVLSHHRHRRHRAGCRRDAEVGRNPDHRRDCWKRRANPKGRKALAEKTGFDEKQILCWANMADRMRIKGVGEEYAELLQAAGVDTVKELKYRNPANLAKAMARGQRQAQAGARCCPRKRPCCAGSSTPRNCR